MYLQKIPLPKLNPLQASILGKPITIEEVNSGITRLQTQKFPGPDGFTALFYKSLCHTLAPVLIKLFNEIGEHEAMTTSMQEATIMVLPKSGKDP
mgnify:CR=1 FL=1